MTPTVGAHDLGAEHAERPVLMPYHRPRDTVEVSRPAAARSELVLGCIQRRIAPCAGVDALVGIVLVIDARSGRFCALLAKDAELFLDVG